MKTKAIIYTVYPKSNELAKWKEVTGESLKIQLTDQAIVLNDGPQLIFAGSIKSFVIEIE